MRGSHVVVAGADSDFGRSLCAAFAERGAVLHLSVRNADKVRRLEEYLRRAVKRPSLDGYSVELREAKQVAEFAERVGQRSGKVDVLINNAARWLDGPFCSATDDDIHEAVRSTLAGSTLVTKGLLPWLLKSEDPRVINLSSMSADPASED